MQRSTLARVVVGPVIAPQLPLGGAASRYVGSRSVPQDLPRDEVRRPVGSEETCPKMGPRMPRPRRCPRRTVGRVNRLMAVDVQLQRPDRELRQDRHSVVLCIRYGLRWTDIARDSAEDCRHALAEPVHLDRRPTSPRNTKLGPQDRAVEEEGAAEEPIRRLIVPAEHSLRVGERGLQQPARVRKEAPAQALPRRQVASQGPSCLR